MPRTRFLPCLMTLWLLAGAAGCHSPATTPFNTRALEETVFDVGYANDTYRYGEELYSQGRYREALAAYQSAEQAAYTVQVREASRQRRIYLEQVVAAYEQGQSPPPPPLTNRQKVDLAYQAEQRRKAEEAAKAKLALVGPLPPPPGYTPPATGATGSGSALTLPPPPPTTGVNLPPPPGAILLNAAPGTGNGSIRETALPSGKDTP